MPYNVDVERTKESLKKYCEDMMIPVIHVDENEKEL